MEYSTQEKIDMAKVIIVHHEIYIRGQKGGQKFSSNWRTVRKTVEW